MGIERPERVHHQSRKKSRRRSHPCRAPLQRTNFTSETIPSVMTSQVHSTLLTRRRFAQVSGMAAWSALLGVASGAAAPPDVTLEIAPHTVEASAKHHIRTVAYNGQVPGPLLRMRQGQQQTIEVRNLTDLSRGSPLARPLSPIGDRWSDGRRHADDRSRSDCPIHLQARSAWISLVPHPYLRRQEPGQSAIRWPTRLSHD